MTVKVLDIVSPHLLTKKVPTILHLFLMQLFLQVQVRGILEKLYSFTQLSQTPFRSVLRSLRLTVLRFYGDIS